MGLRSSRSSLFRKVTRSVRAIWQKTAFRPDIAIILGTGLGNLSNRVTKEAAIPYGAIPNFPHSTVASHAGRLLL